MEPRLRNSVLVAAVSVVVACGGRTQRVVPGSDGEGGTSGHGAGGSAGVGGGVGGSGDVSGFAGASDAGGTESSAGVGGANSAGGSNDRAGAPSGGSGASQAGGRSGGGAPTRGGAPARGGAGGAGGASVRGGAGGTGGLTTICSDGVTASTENNYRVQSSLATTFTKVAPKSDLTFDWSGVTADFRGHPVSPNDIGMVEIALWNLTPEAFNKNLNANTLSQSQLAIIVSIIPTPRGATTGDVKALTDQGTPFAPGTLDPYFDAANYPPGSHVYTAMVATGTVYGLGTRMLQGFQLDASSTNTQVNIGSDSTTLAVTADLHSLAAPAIAAGSPNILVDWTDMTTTAAGAPFVPTDITRVRVASYGMTVAELEDPTNFVRLDSLADDVFEADIAAGTTVSLSLAKDADGAAFPGIDDAHTWLLALDCADCCSPIPWYITVLSACR